MAHLDLLALKVAAGPLRRFVLLDVGPYRLEGEGVRRRFMLAAQLETEGLEIRRSTRVMNALESLARYPCGNHY
jgi:hypothetical protein